MDDSLGDRMKQNYENRTRFYLPRRTYTIYRLDGKNFHSYTKKLKRPYDVKFILDMQRTLIHLCKNIDGVFLGFCQSDEMTLISFDGYNNQTQAWFDGNIQKMVSISASIATAYFNFIRADEFQDIENPKLAYFDSRVFTIADPTELKNSLIWRQEDCTKNAMNSAAQSLYSHKELQSKNWGDMNEMLFQKGINFNNYPVDFRRGSIAIKVAKEGEFINRKTGLKALAMRNKWEIMEDTVLFSSERGQEFLSKIIPKYN